MIIQIYAIVSKEDAESLCKLGTDHIGLVVSRNGDSDKGIVSVKTAKEIIDVIKDYGKIATIITDTSSPDGIKKYVEELHPDIIHICNELSDAELSSLNEMLSDSGVQLMYAVPVKDRSSIDVALNVQRYADFLMLDSPFRSNQMPGFVGATGKTHDWNISAEIVSLSYKPVILGGGLSPENVQDAIRKVRPAGVDAKTSLDIPGGKGRKDIEKVKEFIRKVRELEKET